MKPSDLDECIALLRSDGGCQAGDNIWEALPELWLQMLADEQFASFQVFVEPEDGREKIVAFRSSVFLNEAFARAYRQHPFRQTGMAIWRQTLNGESPVLTRREIARANSLSRLSLGVTHWVTRHRDPRHPETMNILALVPAAWQRGHGGYRLYEVLFYEMFYPEAAAIMSNIGYKHYKLATDTTPGAVFYWPHDSSALGSAALVPAISIACPAPRFFFTPAQKRLISAALDGLRDREIAANFGIRYDTIRQSWLAIYKRVDDVSPGILSSVPSSDGRRGDEKRRVLLEYIRQHLEELRPFDPKLV